MNFLPNTVKGLAPWVVILTVMVFIMFTQAYGWFNWAPYLTKGSTQES